MMCSVTVVLGLDVQVYAGVLREECAGLMRTFF